MPRLEIPYRSQWDGDARRYGADCGPTCVAMVLNYRQVPITPDAVYNFIPSDKGPENGITSIPELMSVIRQHQVEVNFDRYNNATHALDNLRAKVDAGSAVIVLVKYTHWEQATGNLCKVPHFIVVSGYDDANIYIHDPLFGIGRKPRGDGAYFAMPNELFAKGWEEFDDRSLSWQCFFVGKGVAAVQPASASIPPATTPAPVAQPGPAGQTMNDIPRRIRALAAYRRTQPPDFNDPAALQLWQNHLGDWGLQYDQHKVQSGDTLSGLAGRFYGSSGRWHAIRVYNELSGDGFIILGQTIMIPRLGESGADTTSALPSDTADFGKDLDLDDLVDPDLPAMDYDALWGESPEMLFVESNL